jgi:hypothetical protein
MLYCNFSQCGEYLMKYKENIFDFVHCCSAIGFVAVDLCPQ